MDTILSPLYFVVSWILIGWHWLFALVLDDGWSWLLSIVGLVVVVRTALIPLFRRQITASRKLAVLQPQMRELQTKYGHDKQRLQQEMMELYRKERTNPFSSCLPLLLQAPVFFALFRVLNGASGDPGTPLGAFQNHASLFTSFQDAAVLGIPLHDSFRSPDASTGTRVVAIVLVLIMTVTTYITQHQLMRKNMPPEALEGPFAQQQKILLYVLPLGFLFSGLFFPIGVVVYWCVSNLWTAAQQFYVIRNMPAPNTPAEAAYKARMEAKARKKGNAPPEPVETAAPEQTSQPPPRRQPKRQSRRARREQRGSNNPPEEPPEDGLVTGR